MSSWVAERQGEAFALYRSYIAIQLHLKPGAGYDFTQYGGKVRLTLETFLRGASSVRNRFMRIATALGKEESADLFVFANARYGSDIGYGDIKPLLKFYHDWKYWYGDKTRFLKSAARLFREQYLTIGNNKTADDVLISMLEYGGEVEGMIGYFHLRPDQVPVLEEKIKDNAILKARWDHMIKIRALYYHFGIL